jgi:hypothetical protein
VLLRLTYLGVRNAFALLHLLAMNDQDNGLEISTWRTMTFTAERSCAGSPADTGPEHDHTGPRNPQARAIIH